MGYRFTSKIGINSKKANLWGTDLRETKVSSYRFTENWKVLINTLLKANLWGTDLRKTNIINY